MWKYLFWKTITSLIALFVILFIFYTIYTTVKPNPFPDDPKNPHVHDEIIKANFLDKNPIIRFGHWFVGIWGGNFGLEFNDAVREKTIPQKFFSMLPESMYISIPSFVFGMLIGIGLGVWAGYKRGKLTDQIINGVITFFIAIPVFVLAVFAVIIGPMIGLPITFQNQLGLSKLVQSLILPIIVSTVISLAGWSRLMRVEVGNILASDYILAARTKGYSEFFIFKRYVLRNALYPFIGSLVTSFMIVFGSSIVIERYFNIGGVSTYLVNASQNAEVNVLAFNMFVMLAFGLLTQIISDVSLFMINPLVKANFSSKTSPIEKLRFAILRHKNESVEVKTVGGKNE